MKKFLLSASFVLVALSSLAVAAICKGTSTYTYDDGSQGVTNYEYATSNGDCCNPTAGAALMTWTYSGTSGSTIQVFYWSSADAARVYHCRLE